MKRGDLVLVAVPGDFGKPRPALLVQNNLFDQHPSITICLITSHVLEAPLLRYTVEPTGSNGLSKKSQIQIDKLVTIARTKAGQVIGSLTRKQMQEATRLLALFIGIA
jgi:mRNA interferase MazF